ncbi:MAG: transcription elongation factor GreA [Phycisphaerales bacterium]
MDIITQAEQDKIQQRVDYLIANRPVITTRIAEARAMGDLKENAEYHAAREQQGLEEAEIKRLVERLATAQVVSAEKQADGVVFIGSTVKLKLEGDDDDETELYRLVGESSNEDTDDIIEVTTNSPMGEALMKSRIGEVIRVNAPRGVKRFEIVEIL